MEALRKPFFVSSTSRFERRTQFFHQYTSRNLIRNVLQVQDSFKMFRKSPLRGVVAALVGIVIEIKQPPKPEVPYSRTYFNRKKFFELCVQATVTANCKFLFMSATHAGSTQDSTAFQATSLYMIITKDGLQSWEFIVEYYIYVIEECRHAGQGMVTQFMERCKHTFIFKFKLYQ